MGTEIFVARILGPLCVIVALGIILNRDFYMKVMEDYCKNTALVFVGGMMALIVGLVIVLLHNVWVLEWPVIITIYGWGGVLKGTWMIVFPKTVSSFMEVYSKNARAFWFHIGSVLLVGAALTFWGYF